MNKLNIGRACVVIGLLIGWESFFQTFNHIGDPLFMISPEHPGGDTHAWYHCLRELLGDIAAVVALLVVFFAVGKWRTSETWWISLIIMFGYFAPFWIGMPFNEALAAPDLSAEIRHILQAAFCVVGLFIAREAFYEGSAKQELE